MVHRRSRRWRVAECAVVSHDIGHCTRLVDCHTRRLDLNVSLPPKHCRTVGFEKFGNISSIKADNAAVFASDPGIIPSTLRAPKELQGAGKNPVLIAQFTVVEGTEFVWQFNVQGMLGDGVARHTWQEHGVCASNKKDSTHCKKFEVEHTDKNYSDKEEL